jgi:hypothetical protein
MELMAEAPVSAVVPNQLHYYIQKHVNDAPCRGLEPQHHLACRR